MLTHIPALSVVYSEQLAALEAEGAQSVQIDEPMLAMDLTLSARDAYQPTFAAIRAATPGLELMVAAYFSGMRDNLATALALPVDVLDLDLVEEPDQLDTALRDAPASLSLSLSCSLLHLPVELDSEGPAVSGHGIEDEVRQWLAFATRRLDEVRVISAVRTSTRRGSQTRAK